MIRSVCVCGAGTMGRGIALLMAGSGFDTRVYDLDRERLQLARQETERNLLSLAEKKKITEEERSATAGRLQWIEDPDACRADLIIEAVAEDAEIKTALFRRLSAINPAETILASNTSSLSISRLAEAVPRPGRVIGLHFFNPPTHMKLVELVLHAQSNDGVVKEALAFVGQLGKQVVRCQDDPGFIVNHVARPFYLEALRILEKTSLPVGTIDDLMESAGFRMGPFRLMDLIGNDINLAVSQSVYAGLGKPERLKPSSIQEAKVAAGELGRKSGKGFYSYA